MRVTLVRAWQDRHEQALIEAPAGASVGDALRAAGWALEAGFAGLAVFGVAATEATQLRDGDRIELLRPLQMDPKQARRLRAQRAREREAGT